MLAGSRKGRELVSLSPQSLETLFGSVTSWQFRFPSKHSSRIVTRWPQFVLTSACWPNVFCRLWGGGKELEPASDTPEQRGCGSSPILPRCCCQRMDELPPPLERCPARDGARGPRRQLVMFLVILCRKGVLGVLWLFSLDHLSAAVFNELEKK